MTRIYWIGFAVLTAALVLPGSAFAQLDPLHGPLVVPWYLIPCEDMPGCFTYLDGTCHCEQGPPRQEYVSVTNTGESGGVSPGGDLCADIYVFHSDQQMSECCGCKVTPDGLLTLGLRSNLLSNPLTGVVGKSGTIRIVSSVPNGGLCDASSPGGTAELVAWGTPLGTSAFTETAFKEAAFNASELSKLATECGFIQAHGSGHGVCRCPSGQ